MKFVKQILLLLLLSPALPAFAQEYPNRPIPLVVPFSAGGPGDVIARLLGTSISATLKQPLVIENVVGAGGTIGALLTGIFATSAVNPIFTDPNGKVLPSGLLEGNARQLFSQLVGVAIAWILATVGTLIILKIVDRLVGLRVTEDQETQGLDLSQHGEEGYYWDTSA